MSLSVVSKRFFSVKRGMRTGKHGPRWFNKGKGCVRLGTTKRDVYRWGLTREDKPINIDKVLDFQIPSLDQFKLKPYVGWQAPK